MFEVEAGADEKQQIKFVWPNARLEDLQEAESSHSLTLVRSFAVRSRWLAKDTQ